jgi:cell fate regulator YaaT (PSP1 superfamily)
MEAEITQRQVAGVRFTKVGKLYHFDYSDFPDLQAGDFVIVETARGRHMGQVMGFTMAEDDNQPLKSILRPASSRDLMLRQEWEDRQPEALVVCREWAQKLGGFGDVKFVAAQYNYDGSQLTFLFSAEQKVNIGGLWSELNKVFDAQVEMRQIGPRDVAKLLGGYGACGELRCCSTFLTDFSPISIKMAKVQGISLNPSEITGMCGRLRCCLVYEYEQYVAARKQLPKRNKRIGTPFGVGKVIDVHPLQDAVTVIIEDEGRRTIQREDLVPLEELEALQKKAKEPCSKHGDEPCDCGKPPGERMADKVDQPTAEKPSEDDDKAARKDDGDDKDDKKEGQRRSSSRRRSGRRGRRRRPQNKNKQDKSDNE